MPSEGIYFPTPQSGTMAATVEKDSLVPESDSPLHMQLASIMRSKIDAHEWREGEAIPSESTLMGRYDISRGTVRHAIHTLALEGYLVSVKGCGTFVAERGLVRPAVRRPLSFSALLRERGMDYETSVLLKEVVPASRDVAVRLGVGQGTPVMFMRRVRTVDGVALVCQESWSSLSACPSLDEADFESESLFDAVERCSRRSISSSVVHYMSSRAGKEHAGYLSCAEDDTVLVLEQNICLDNGTPIEWSLTWLRPGESVVGVSLQDQIETSGQSRARHAGAARYDSDGGKALRKRLELGALAVRRGIVELAHRYEGMPFHMGGGLSMAELVAVLYGHVMHTGRDGTPWEQRDRLVLSKAHASIALYPAMLEAGLISQDDLDRGILGQDAVLFRHPERDPARGFETSGGSLGMGLGYAAGLALSLRRRALPSRVFCIVGDGECDEGSIWESAAFAGFNKLSNLTVVIDANGMQLDGPTSEILDNGPIQRKLESFGFEVEEADGHDVMSLTAALEKCSERPRAVVARTTKGFGLSFSQGKVEWHDKALDEELYERALRELDAREREVKGE